MQFSCRKRGYLPPSRTKVQAAQIFRGLPLLPLISKAVNLLRKFLTYHCDFELKLSTPLSLSDYVIAAQLGSYKEFVSDSPIITGVDDLIDQLENAATESQRRRADRKFIR